MKLNVILRIVSLALLILALAACSQSDEALSAQADQDSPQTSRQFVMADGSVKVLGDFHGEWLLINYWAVWCGPCVKEIPELNALDEQNHVSVLGFNFDQTEGEELAKQLVQLQVEFGTMMNDPAALFDQPMPTALPATMVIDPEGNFEEWLMGPQTKDDILQRLGLGQKSG